MDPVIPAIVGASAGALLFALLALKSWAADRRARRDAVTRRLK